MSSSPTKERILIVDDSGTTLEVLQRNLAAAGYRVFRIHPILRKDRLCRRASD